MKTFLEGAIEGWKKDAGEIKGDFAAAESGNYELKKPLYEKARLSLRMACKCSPQHIQSAFQRQWSPGSQAKNHSGETND